MRRGRLSSLCFSVLAILLQSGLLSVAASADTPTNAVSTRYDLLTTPVEKPVVAGKPFRYPDGSEYTGEWLRGLPHGDGKLRFRNGDEYFGHFWHGLPKGIGMFEDVEGNRYTGEWSQGRRQGDGIMEYTSGARYEGTWSNDMREGRGRLVFKGGTRYEGGWKKDMRHGQGEIRYPDGARYSGDYAFNMKHGYGAETDSAGATYNGTFSRDKRHGSGDCTDARGHSRICVFNHGLPIEDPAVLARAEKLKKNYEPEFVFDGGLSVLWENLTTHQKRVMREPAVRYWKKSSLLGDQLRIECKGGRGFMVVRIRHFDGPGEYTLSEEDFIVSVDQGRALLPASGKTATLTISSETDGVLEGSFSAEILREDGQITGEAYRIHKARFEARQMR